MSCESEICEVFLGQVFPIIGSISSSLISIAPMTTVLKAEREQDLKSLNTLPFALLFLNNLAWIFYAYIAENIYVFFANIVAVTATLYYTIVCYPLDIEKNKKIVKIIFVSGFCFILCLSAYMFIAIPGQPEFQINLIGWVSLIFLVLFYSSPLSTLMRVVKQKNAASIHFALAWTCLGNSSLWACYGLFIGDWFIAGPNITGALLSVVQVVAKSIYKSIPEGDNEDFKAGNSKTKDSMA